ncbi:hypothetical protein [Paenibacillus sp. PL2-23]|uniref:glycan biosynthesis hexose transferase WsfD n=1 Tax=Paenibacillus sp. PL2-23 TaxID=2100729 RepID=UPI0030F724D7
MIIRPGTWSLARQAAASLSRRVTPAMLAAMALAAIASAALFVKPFIGMADNGDFYRILYGNGLYFSAPDYAGQYFGYFVKGFGILQHYNEHAAAILSSQSLFIRLAVWLNTLLYSPSTFDIRFQGALYLALYMGAVYLLVESVTWQMPRARGNMIALLAVLQFGDTGYTAYFHSFYGESVVLIMSVFMAASGLLLHRRRYNDYALLALFVASALLLTTAKQQNAPVGVIAAVVGIALLLLSRTKVFRITALTSLLLLLAAGIGVYALIPQEFVNINQYHAMTRGPLMTSGNPEEALAFFGIDEQYAILAGGLYYERYPTIDVNSPLLEQGFYSQYGFFSILRYYLAHPPEALDMLRLAARHAFTIRPEAMGNFELSEGRAFREHTHFFTLYSWFKSRALPNTFGFIVIWAIVVLGLYTPSFLTAVRAKDYRSALKLPILLMLMLIGLSSMAVSVIGAGDADLAKHEFLFTVSFDLVLFVGLADLIRTRSLAIRAFSRRSAG